MVRLPPAPLLIEAQTSPTVPAPQPGPLPPPETSTVGLVVGTAVVVLFVLLLLLAARKLFFKKRPPGPKPLPGKPTEPPSLPEPGPLPQQFKVELPQTAAEAQRLADAEAAYQQAQTLAQQRRELAEAARKADAEQKARLQAEAQALKEREEQAKRDEYRARKDAEQQARERHQREREASERLRREAEAATAAAEAQRLRAAEEAQRRKVQAEGGRTLAQGLDKTRTQGFMARLNTFFGEQKQVDESVLAELEEILFTADIGVRTASHLVELAREKARRNELTDSARMKEVIRQEIQRIVDLPAPVSLQGGGPPHVVMVVGVNGSGKTTTIGKLAAKLTSNGKTVVLAAADTFRAAATEQLDVWAGRAGAALVKGPADSDPGSVAFEGVKKGVSEGADAVIVDTAGRLHTRAPLMEELKKVHRVMDKALPGAPHEVLLVVDATTGQNAIAQAKLFGEAVKVTGLALTKLDGTAKGGVIIGICDELKIPVLWVGVGEKIEDLRRFDPREFVAALFD
jgi:fused signal recognition particle receptor